jgi:hypothetical protein
MKQRITHSETLEAPPRKHQQLSYAEESDYLRSMHTCFQQACLEMVPESPLGHLP